MKAEKNKETKAMPAINEEKLKEAQRLAEEFKDKYLRAHAELDNARKRFAKEREEYIKFANQELLCEILCAVDNFDRALQHIDGTKKADSIFQGIQMIQRQFHSLLRQHNVEKIEALGKKFDPALHEAIEHIEADDDKEDVVIEEIQTGYLLDGRLLRPAVVKVGKKRVETISGESKDDK